MITEMIDFYIFTGVGLCSALFCCAGGGGEAAVYGAPTPRVASGYGNCRASPPISRNRKLK